MYMPKFDGKNVWVFWFTSLLILHKMSDWANRSFVNSETIDTNSHVTNIDL